MRSIVEQASAAEPFTSRVLNPLFTGKSANTPGFLMAVLKNEGLVRPSTSKRRCWQLGNVEAFEQQVVAMLNAPSTQKKKSPVKPARKQAADSPAPEPANTTKPTPVAKTRAKKQTSLWAGSPS